MPVEATCGWLPDALAPLLEAIEGSEDPSLTLEMLRDAYEFAGHAGNHDQLVEITRRAAQVDPATETDRFIAAALMAWGSELSATMRVERYSPRRRSSAWSDSTTRAA